MKRRIVVEIEDDVVTVEGGGDDLEPQAKVAMLLLGAKKLREGTGIILLSVIKDQKTQSVGLDFQKDEIKNWGEAVAMLDGAKRVAEFQEWFGMFAGAQQALAQQAHQAMQAQAVAQHVQGNGGGSIFKRPHR